jgi:hypothetical protein
MRSAVIGWTLVLASVLIPAASWAQTVNACDSQAPPLNRGGWVLDVSYHRDRHGALALLCVRQRASALSGQTYREN